MSPRPAVLDTSVASFLVSERPEADLYREELAGRHVFLPFQAEAELLAGADLSSWGQKKRLSLKRFIASLTIVHTDRDVVGTWAELRRTTRQDGIDVETADLWVAAVALSKSAVLFAHDAVFRQVPELKLICHAPGNA